MGDEHAFAEGLGASGVARVDFGGDTGKIAPRGAVFRIEKQGDKTGFCGPDLVTELASDVVAEACSAHFRDGESAGGDDEDGSAKFCVAGRDNEFGGARDFLDATVAEDADAGFAALEFEHGEDVLRGAVAEELAELLFVVANAVLFDERDEIGGGTAGEGGFREVFVGADEIFGLGVPIREIAATAAGDKDFLAAALGSLEDGDATPAFTGFDSAHQAGGATADHDGVEGICGDRFGHFCGVPHQG